jgi:hypothetical protein
VTRSAATGPARAMTTTNAGSGTTKGDAPSPPPGSGTVLPRSLGAGLLLLAAALAGNVVAGPLGADVIDYPISTSMDNQLRGLELVTMFLVVPWLVATGVLALRNHPGAPLLAFAPAGYAAYMFLQYVLGPEYSTYSWAVLFHVAVFSLSGWLTLSAWRLAAARPVPLATRAQHRRRACLMLALAGFVLVRYVPVLVGATDGRPLPAELQDGRTFFWSIVLLDLGVVVPLTLVAGLASWRGTPAGERSVYAVVGWFALVPPSVAAMAAVMVARGDPYASLPTTLLLTAASLLFAGVAAGLLRPLLRREGVVGPAARVPGSRDAG